MPPARPGAVEVKDKTWPGGEIDRFVLQKLEGAGIKPSPEADKRTLIRRLSFDLTGLPPTREEIRAFLADESPGAYTELVDRLLGRPAVRRAHGALLARPGALRRHQRHAQGLLPQTSSPTATG